MPAPVVRETDAADDAEDAVGVLDRVGEALEGHTARAFRGNEAIGVLMEGTAAAAGREGLECGEAHVDEEVVGARNRGCEHQIGLAVGQGITREFDGVKGTGAGGVEGEGAIAEAEVQCPRGQKGGQPRREAIACVDAVGGAHAAPDLLGEVGETR